MNRFKLRQQPEVQALREGLEALAENKVRATKIHPAFRPTCPNCHSIAVGPAFGGTPFGSGNTLICQGCKCEFYTV